MPKNIFDEIDDLEEQVGNQTATETATEGEDDHDDTSETDGSGGTDRSDATGTEEGDDAADTDEGADGNGGTDADGKRLPQRDGKPSRSDSSDASETRKDEVNDETTPTGKAFAEMRRTLKEQKALIESLTKPKDDKADKDGKGATDAPADPEPDKAKNPAEWTDWKIRQQDKTIAELSAGREQEVKQRKINDAVSGAIGEFIAVEKAYEQTNPHYAEAMKFGRDAYARSFKLLHPEWNDQSIDKAIDFEILKIAGEFAKRGQNPAEELYKYAVSKMGFKPTEKPAGDGEGANNNGKGVARKTNLRVVNNNRRRSASGLSQGGQGGKNQLTKEVAADMTNAEFAALDDDDVNNILAMDG